MIMTLFAVLTIAASTVEAAPKRRDCLLVAELDSGKVVRESDPAFCGERLSPCSTFKIPLALTALDAGVLDEKQVLKWDGTKQPLKAWEADQDLRGWLKESVVWFSQRLTPKIGLKRIETDLEDFRYGNKDFSGGLTKAWLNSSLKISAREQVDFLRRMRKHELKIAAPTVDKVLAALPAEVDKPDLRIFGKTGSSGEKSPRFGWYVGFMDKGDKRYVFARVFTEEKSKKPKIFGGKEAKADAIKTLEGL